jgi:Uma2 family endonuclease
MPVSEATYERLALEDPDGKWELVCGRPRQKPPMTTEHDDTARNLMLELALQVPRREFSVDKEGPKLRVPSGNYRIPDVCVIPRPLIARRKAVYPARLEVYDDPMPLVVEVWSSSTGNTDLTDKLREYQERGDLEIWRLHPYERTLTTWVQQPDGTYRQTHYTGGTVRPTFLPNVAIELERLFD